MVSSSIFKAKARLDCQYIFWIT